MSKYNDLPHVEVTNFPRVETENAMELRRVLCKVINHGRTREYAMDELLKVMKYAEAHITRGQGETTPAADLPGSGPATRTRAKRVPAAEATADSVE